MNWRPNPDRVIFAAVYVGAAALAAFAFGQSYKHIYDLGRVHHQDGWTSLLLPLSVDVVIVVATLILVLQRRYDEPPTGLAKWMPRLMLYVGIAATIGANLLYGLPFGYETAGISTWPGVVFAGLCETVLVAVRPPTRKAANKINNLQVSGFVPASSLDAAKTAAVAAVAAAHPLSGYALSKRFGVTITQGNKIAAEAKMALNGHSDE